MIGLGMKPDELQDGVSRHLYGILEPTDPVPSTEEYLQQAVQTVDRVHASGNMVIIEGCSYSYTEALIGHYGIQHVVRLTWKPEDRVRLVQYITARFDELVESGLYDETRRALDKGYEDTYPMSSLLYRPAIQVVRGAISHEGATRLTITEWLAAAIRTDSLYAKIPALYTLTLQIIPTVTLVSAVRSCLVLPCLDESNYQARNHTESTCSLLGCG
jgi:tRNA A37 N6-isopentenylltransferase MiaA